MPGLPVLTCASCQALLLIERGTATKVGEAGTVPFDVSPIQLGTTLLVDGKRGEVVGRERWAWDGGSWNEWLLNLPGGDHRWVAEEAGQYMVMAPVTLHAAEASKLAELGGKGDAALGQRLQVGERWFTVADIKTIRCVASEGHLPAPVPANYPRHSLDLRSAGAQVLTWQNDRNGSGCWIGQYQRLAELAPARLRELEGWGKPDFEAAS